MYLSNNFIQSLNAYLRTAGHVLRILTHLLVLTLILILIFPFTFDFVQRAHTNRPLIRWSRWAWANIKWLVDHPPRSHHLRFVLFRWKILGTVTERGSTAMLVSEQYKEISRFHGSGLSCLNGQSTAVTLLYCTLNTDTRIHTRTRTPIFWSPTSWS